MSKAENVRVEPSLGVAEELLTVEAMISPDGKLIGQPVEASPEALARANAISQLTIAREQTMANITAEADLISRVLQGNVDLSQDQQDEALHALKLRLDIIIGAR